MVTDVFTIAFPWFENENQAHFQLNCRQQFDSRQANSLRPNSSEQLSSTQPDSVRHYIAGPENKLLRIAYQAVKDYQTQSQNQHTQSNPLLNPLVFYGNTGVGKSHIAQGLQHQFYCQHPQRKFFRITGSDYLRSFRFRSFATESLESYKSQPEYSNFLDAEHIDCLLLDNLHEIKSHEAAQDSLSNFLDQLQQQGSLVLITSLENPLHCAKFSDRLKSRLAAGMIVPVKPPAISTKEVILQQQAQALGLSITKVAARKLAELDATTFPSLRSLLLNLSMQGQVQTIDSSTISRFLNRESKKRLFTVSNIASLIARYYGIKISELKSSSRKQAIVQARNCAIYFIRKKLAISYQAIGHYFGGRDHTTIMHGFLKTEESIETDPATSAAITEIELLLAQQAGEPTNIKH